MRLCAIFLILNIHLSHIFASPPNPSELSSESNHNLQGYECGDVFFTYDKIKDTLLLALYSMDKGYLFPQKYLSPLYIESRYEDYFIYPIRKGQKLQPKFKRAKTVFYVVLTRKSNIEVDVVAKITTGDYTKCIRRYRTHMGLSHSVPENTNGYQCAHKFLTDDIIHQSLALAQTKVEGNPIYPSLYVGNLYPKNSGHLIWPIIKGNELYQSGTAELVSYFLILNDERQFVDVVVKGFNNNYLRCIKSRKPPKAPASDPLSMLFAPPARSGYICGKNFFSDAVLDENVEIARNEAGKKSRGEFPKEYSGPPVNEQSLIWPLMHDGRLFRKGFKGPYRLLLTPHYKFLSVAMFVNGKLKACEKKTIISQKNHDTSDYDCNEQYFSHQHLVKAAEEACEKMNIVTRNFYPASYTGPEFMLDGPYYTYPVFQKSNRKFRFRAGLHRVVINKSCEVVGALTSLQENNIENLYDSPKRLVKCHRLADGPLPSGFFGANAETVFEV